MNIINLTDRYPLNHSQVKIDKNNTVQVKTYLTVDEFVNAVKTIVDACFIDGKYMPEFKDIAKRYMLLTTFTDIEFGSMSIEEIFKVSQNKWYYDIEDEVSESPIYYEIICAADEAIDYKIRTRRTSFDDLCVILSDFAEKMGDTTALSNIANRLEKLSDKEVAEVIVNKGSDA